MAIRIVTDSAADYTKAEIEKRNIICIPMTVSFGDEVFTDGVDLEKEEFFERLKNSKCLPHTAQPSPASFLDCFEEAKTAGDTVIAILISGALSGTIQSAQLAKEIAQYDDIYIVDSCHATLSMRILVDQAVIMRHQGVCAKEIVAMLEKLKQRVTIYAGLDTLEYLYKGGRISRTEANLGKLINIKPVLTFTTDGSVVLCGKQVGFRHVFKQVLQLLEAAPPDMDYPVYFIHSGDKKNCVKFVQYLMKQTGEFEEPKLRGIGPTIGTHIGPGAFGIVYVRK